MNLDQLSAENTTLKKERADTTRQYCDLLAMLRAENVELKQQLNEYRQQFGIEKGGWDNLQEAQQQVTELKQRLEQAIKDHCDDEDELLKVLKVRDRKDDIDATDNIRILEAATALQARCERLGRIVEFFSNFLNHFANKPNRTFSEVYAAWDECKERAGSVTAAKDCPVCHSTISVRAAARSWSHDSHYCEQCGVTFTPARAALAPEGSGADPKGAQE